MSTIRPSRPRRRSAVSALLCATVLIGSLADSAPAAFSSARSESRAVVSQPAASATATALQASVPLTAVSPSRAALVGRAQAAQFDVRTSPMVIGAARAETVLRPETASVGAVVPTTPLPACVTSIYGYWPKIQEGTPAAPCYLSHPPFYNDMHMTGPVSQTIHNGDTVALGITGSPAGWGEEKAAWLLSWNNLFDFQPLMRGSDLQPANSITGYQFHWIIPPEIDDSGCYDSGGGYLYGRFVATCTLRFGKGPYYGTTGGQTMPWTVFTASTYANGFHYNTPIVTNCGGTCDAQWGFTPAFTELPVFIQPSPYAGFYSATSGDAVQFTDGTLSDLTISSYHWDFGDGSTSSLAAPKHRFPAQHAYNVTLTVTASDGQTDAASASVTPPPPAGRPVAAFTVSPGAGEAGHFSLVSNSTDPNGSALNQQWSAPNGAVSSLIGPAISVAYATPGNFDVTLTVTNQQGQTDSVTHTIAVAAPTLAMSVTVVDGSASVRPGDPMTVRINVAASSDGVGSLTGLRFDSGFSAGLKVTANVDPLFTIHDGPTPALRTSLAPGDSAVTIFHLTAGVVGSGAVSSGVRAATADGRVVTTSASANVKVSEHALTVTITPAKTDFKLAADATDKTKPVPQTIEVKVAIKNTTTAAVDNVMLGPLDIAALDPLHPYEPFPVDVIAPNDNVDVGTIAGGATKTIVRSIKVKGDGAFSLKSLALSDDGPALGTGELKVGVTTMLAVVIDGDQTRQTVVGGSIVVRGRFTNVTNDRTVALTDPMKVLRTGNLLGGGMIVDGDASADDPFPAPVMGMIEPGKSVEFQVRFRTARPSADEYDEGSWNSDAWTKARISFLFSPRAAVAEDDGTWAALTTNSVTVSYPGGPSASPYPSSIAIKGDSGGAIDVTIDARNTMTSSDVLTRSVAAGFGFSVGALEAVQDRMSGLLVAIKDTPQFVFNADFRDRQLAALMPDIQKLEAFRYLSEMAVWLPQADTTEIVEAVSQRLHDAYASFDKSVTGGIPHATNTTVAAIGGVLNEYILTLQSSWRQGDPNAIIDAFRPLGNTVGGIATDVALQEAAFEGLVAFMRSPRYVAAATARWQSANTIATMQATIPSAAETTLALKAGEVSKSNFPMLEEAYLTRQPLTDAQLGAGLNNDGAGISKEVIDRNREFSRTTGKSIVVLPNEAEVATALDDYKAMGKIENMKPKTLADIEFKVFGGRPIDRNRVVLRDLKLTEAQANALIQSAIDAGTITEADRVIAKQIWKRRKKEWAIFKAGGKVDDAGNPIIDAATGKIVPDDEGIGLLNTYDLNHKIPNQFRGVDNGLTVNGPKQELRFRLDRVSDDYVVPMVEHPVTKQLVPFTGDVDGLWMGEKNGLGLLKSQLEQAYASVLDVYNHPFSDTWLAAVDKKLAIFSRYFTETLAPGASGAAGKPLVMFVDGEAYAVKIDAMLTRFDTVTNRAFIAWDGAPISVDPSLLQSLFPAMTAIAAPVKYLGLPASFLRIFFPHSGGDVPPLKATRAGKVVRINTVGQTESWTLAGGWVLDPSVEIDAIHGELAIVPQTLSSGSTAVGDRELSISPPSELDMVGAWFQVGDIVVLDPGGPNQETATIAGFGSLIFTAPLTKPHAQGEVVALVDGSGAGYVPLLPARLYESRSGAGYITVDGLAAGMGRRRAGDVTVLHVAGRGGVAGDTSSVVLNVTVVDPVAAGYVTVYPCGADRPLASTVNFGVGATVANSVVVRVGAGGDVCVYSLVESDLVVDVGGYFPVVSDLVTSVPARILETRSGDGFATVDGQAAGGGARTGGDVTELVVAGRGGVTPGASTAVLNLTVVDPSAAGYVTAYPCGADRPLASTVNFAAGATVANSVIVRIGDGGKVCLYSLVPSDLVVDVSGSFPATSELVPLVPARLLESRSGEGFATVDGASAGFGTLAGDSVTRLHVAGRGGAPIGSTAVALNVTVVDPAAAGYVTAYPCGGDRPLASTVNFAAGSTVANSVIVRIGDGGDVCLYSLVPTDLVVDIGGAFAAAS